MQVFVVGAAIREPMSQTRIAAVVASTGSQPRLEEHDRTLQVSLSLSNGSSNLSMRSSRDLRSHETANAHCPATTAALSAMDKLVTRCSWSFRRTSSTVSLAPHQADKGLHDLFDANFRSAPIISRHAATHVALGDDADQHEG